MTGLLNRHRAAPASTVGHFTARQQRERTGCTVVLAGELDIAGRAAALQACTPADRDHVIVDLHALDFMDCAGYGAILAARTVIEQRGGTLFLTGARGEPLRLVSLVSTICAPPQPVPVTEMRRRRRMLVTRTGWGSVSA